MPLHGLSALIYPILRQRVPAEDPRISYQQLVDALGPLPPPNQNLQAFDKRLFDALGEIGTNCLQHNPPLPALSSIVVQKQGDDSLGMPGPGYYPVVHPDAQTEDAKLEAWSREYNLARENVYPRQIV